MPEQPNFIVLTGGPGAGKTTLIEALAADGFATSEEAGRRIIQDQVAIGGPGHHWGDRALYAELMLAHELRSWRRFEGTTAPVFFDRGLGELPGYLAMCGLPIPDHFQTAAEIFRYHPRVFGLPPWREIYATDAERSQTWDEAVETYELCKAAWEGLGYEWVVVPPAPVAERRAFVKRLVLDP